MNAPTSTPTEGDQLRIDFLFLDLETCTRCRGTHSQLGDALDTAREVLAATGTEVELSRIHVTSPEQARRLRFVSSPTIRLNGRDIAFELRESSCGSEACTDGCGDSIDCRVWVHGGQEHTEPPAAMIVDAILREVSAGTGAEREPEDKGYELPENLDRFFAGRAAIQTGASTAIGSERSVCCSPAEQRTCCEPADKGECCGSTTGGGCGCR